VSQSFGIQKAHSNEHAGRPGWQGAVHHNAIRTHPGKPEHKDAMWYVIIMYLYYLCKPSYCVMCISPWANAFLFTAEEMDQADEELRETIRHIWPLQARKILDLLIPKGDCGFF